MFLTLVLGSGIGAVGRSTITNIMKAKRLGLWATLLVNLTGCLIAGLLLGAHSASLFVSLLIGFIGGFTTYSTFNGELASFFFQHQYLRLCVYLLISYGGGLLACYLGYQFIQMI
ncbi:fluoride efflux transporter FluC [Fructilactobacillus carniphilus]|uniref:Fluoride-specific ion channel FluC n=1 Tax=Fructilactobacillus carniphilus TaxID=2940297 RepID=A0ABY5BZK1_9LACO|nr:CrcB family protein [Fructilactobacillus carniphilus]USS91214.1 CrcB family protein [Fructilactobacillus carniphilus]